MINILHCITCSEGINQGIEDCDLELEAVYELLDCSFYCLSAVEFQFPTPAPCFSYV